MARERKGRFANPAAVLTDADSVARYGAWIEALLVSLVDEGFNPMLVSAGETGLARGIPEQTLARLVIPGRGWGRLWPGASHRLIQQLEDEPVRILVATSGRLARYGAWLAGRLDVPLIVIVMGQGEVAPAASVAPKALRLFAGSEPLCDQLRQRIGPGADDLVRPILLGVHLGEPAGAFSQAGPERSVGIVGVGPLEPGNNFDGLVGAFARLSERRRDAVCFIIGSGPAEPRLRKLAAARGLTGRLTFVPELRRLADLYHGIDVFVQPFLAAQLDLRALEAMAAGLVVLARNGGACDLIDNGVNGVELVGGDEAELAGVIQRLLDEPALGRRIGAGARQYVQEKRLAGVTVQPIIRLAKEIALSRRTFGFPPGQT